METFDFAIGCQYIDKEEDFFVECLKEECKARHMQFICIDDECIDKIEADIKKGKVKIKFYLDIASDVYNRQDKYTRFNYCLRDNATRVVADPDDVKTATDKSVTHYDLVRSKVPVPYTIIIRNWEPERRLTRQERKRLGMPLVIKPALGYGQKGIKVIDKRYTFKDIAKARNYNRGDNFLLQEFIEPLDIEGEPAWFRVYSIFGEIILCWWNPQTHHYRQVTMKEVDVHGLFPLARIASEIARITRIDWFSCEIAKCKRNRKFVAIDYMNDQFAIAAKSQHKDGVPDEVVAHLASRIVEKAWQYNMGKFTLTYRGVWFPMAKVKDENA